MSQFSGRVRFGPYEVDLRTGELWKGSVPLKLQDLPFRVLGMLLEKPGEVVTRDELQHRLWESETFVDYDHSLNTAVNKLRAVLSDPAARPRYVETVGRGYRFVAEVQRETGGSSAAAVPESIPSIAVLPFANLSADPQDEYFSDGLTEELINALTAIRGLRVVARTSVFRFKGRTGDIREIGRQLGVENVLEGSVRKSGSRIRVTAQLIHVADGYHLWAKSYDRQIEDVFAIQEEVASQAVQEISPRFLPQPARRCNVEAYGFYLQGRHYQNRRMDGFQKALEFFKRSVQIDPLYASAHAGIADVYSMLSLLGSIESRGASAIALDAAKRAVVLDPLSSESHAALGFAEAIFDWNLASAAKRFERALELEPGNADAHTGFAFCCHLPLKRVERAVALTERARDLNPFDGAIYVVRAYAECLRGNYAAARQQYEILMGFEPDFPHIHISMSGILHAEGKHDEALRAVRKGVQLRRRTGEPDSDVIASLAYSLAIAGEVEERQRCIDELTARSAGTYVSPWCFALVYSGLRDSGRCLEQIDRMVNERSGRTIMLTFDPRFDWLRANPEFGSILRRCGFEELGNPPAKFP